MTKEEAISRVKGYLTACLPIDGYEELEEIMGILNKWWKSEAMPL